MSKTAKKDTLINHFNEIFNLIDNQELTDSQQLTLLHLLNRLNRNFWKPVKVSENKLAGAMSKDKRTVAKALKELEKLQIISISPKGEINIEFKRADTIEPDNTENNRRNESEESTDFRTAGSKSSVGNSQKIEHSDSNFKGLEIFAPSET